MAAFWRSFTDGCLGQAGMAHCVRSSFLGHAVPTAPSPAARSAMAPSQWWSPVHGGRRTSGEHLHAAWIRCASKIGRCRLRSALRHHVGSNSLQLATARRAASCFGEPRRVSSRLLHGAAGHGPGRKLLRQHGVDGVPRSPDEKSMHFLSGFYHRSERARRGEAVEKSSFHLNWWGYVIS